ncbi:MAG: AAA family ATPase [Planctomycetota bacterium]
MSDELNFNAPTAAAPREDEASRRRQQLMALLRGRLHWALLLAALLGGGLGYLGHQSVTPMYRSTGEARIEPDELMFNIEGVLDTGRWTSFLRTQENLIKSAEVAERAMRNPAWEALGLDPNEWDAGAFAGAIEVDYDDSNRMNNIITVSFDAVSGDIAGAGNQSLMQAYRQEFGYQATNAMLNRLGRLQAQVQRAELAIKQELAQRGTVLTPAEYQQLGSQIAALTDQEIELDFMLQTVEARLESRNPVIEEGVANTMADMITRDPVLRELQTQKDTVLGLIQEQEMLGYGPGHLSVKRLITRRDVLTQRMDDRYETLMSAESAVTSTDPEYNELVAMRQQLSRQLLAVTRELEQLTAKQADIAGIEQEIASRQAIIEEAKEKISEINVERDGAENTVRIMAVGGTPTAPFNGGEAVQMAGIAGLSGVFLGFGLVMGIGLLDRRLRHAGDARMGLPDTRMLGILPTLPENFADPESSEKAAHAVHHIRTLLQISNRGTARVFSVTSPAAGSGKSSLSVALGLSFAASESKTLVIDCDLVGAGLTRRVGAVVNRSVEAILREDTVLSDDQIDQAVAHAREQGVNLKDALVEKGLLTKKDLQRLNRRQQDSALGVLDACQGRPFSECVAQTGIENFSVLPIGAAKPQDAGLLSPKALRSLINRAREEYDIVLIDTGPCLGSLEASMAAAEVDATVLIVSRGDSKAMATRAHDHLVSVGANVVGVVFNHALEADMNHSSFASIVSQERRTDPAQSLLSADPAVAARFGPLGSAVAAFGTPSKSPNGRPRRPAATNGSHS